MKALVGTFLSVLALAAAMTSLVRAEDGTQPSAAVTLKGTLLCAKCFLGQGDKCQNVLKVKEGEKETLYYLTPNDLSNDEHGKVCKEPKDGVTVTGTVEDKDGKKWLTASKIDMG
jgi:hypothetical protein